MVQLSCWKRSGPSPKYCHRVGSAALSRMSTYISEFIFSITGTNGSSPNHEKHPNTIVLPPPNLTVGTIQSLKKRSPGNRPIHTRPSVARLSSEIHHSKVRKKKRASKPRKNIDLTAKEIESSSSPNKISESHTSKMETMNEIKIKQEEDLDADEENLQQPITIIKNDIRFEDLQTFFQKYNLEIPIQTFIRKFESTCDSFNIPEKQKLLFIIKLVDGAVKTYIQSQSIPKSFYELKINLIREFETQVNPADIHLQLSKTEKTSKETHIEYFYRVKEIASRINMEEEAEKYYILRGLKENRDIEIQLQSCSNIEELKEKMKLLDIQ
ncbi:hypothetical protein TNCV_2992651 [Trichonephila clavipes]|nr:hypothetical protein TNCV_2992651 [Trichonephila clavipes]